MQALSVWSQVCKGSAQSASAAQSLSESGMQALDCPPGGIALQVRSAVSQYRPGPQALLEVQPPTAATQRPGKALENLPPGEAAAPAQTPRRTSGSPW